MDKKKKDFPIRERQRSVAEETAEYIPEADAAETPAEPAAEAAEKTVEEQLREELESAKAAAEDFKRKWYLVSAEYENYRKRTAAVAAYRYVEGRSDVIKGLFPIADNLERALEACRFEGTKKGIQMVITAFDKLLEEENIEVIDPLGQPFDPERCEAIMAVEPENGEKSGIVKQVYSKGYVQNDKVLRYAQVIVTK